MRLALRLAALALGLVGALVAALTRPASRLVALGEDHFSSQGSVLATSEDAAGSDLALLDGWASDYRAPGRQRHHCRRHTRNDCQNQNRSSHGTPPAGKPMGNSEFTPKFPTLKGLTSSARRSPCLDSGSPCARAFGARGSRSRRDRLATPESGF